MVQMTMSCPLSLEMSVLRAHSIDSASHSFHLPLFMLTLLVSILQILQITSLFQAFSKPNKAHYESTTQKWRSKNRGGLGLVALTSLIYTLQLLLHHLLCHRFTNLCLEQAIRLFLRTPMKNKESLNNDFLFVYQGVTIDPRDFAKRLWGDMYFNSKS